MGNGEYIRIYTYIYIYRTHPGGENGCKLSREKHYKVSGAQESLCSSASAVHSTGGAAAGCVTVSPQGNMNTSCVRIQTVAIYIYVRVYTVWIQSGYLERSSSRSINISLVCFVFCFNFACRLWDWQTVGLSDKQGRRAEAEMSPVKSIGNKAGLKDHEQHALKVSTGSRCT